jgi:site-specific DNA recombinase
MRVALYARYSSDLQNERSAEDQLGALRAVAQARGYLEVATFADRGISGAALGNRPGVQTLLREAELGRFDVLLTEALDRLSRDQEGTAHLFKRLGYHGVELHTLSEGKISELHVGLTGTMNQLFLVELAKKTLRGLKAKVQQGFSGGGRCYGYDIPAKGELVVNEEQAKIVRRIFRDYAKGVSPKSLAHALNAEGVPGPRGGTWAPSAIYGDRRAKDGILCQELYVGVRIWNRRRFRKHPDTGKRSSVLNPESEWMREPVPQLRILDDETWSAVKARQKAIAEGPAKIARQPKRLLSGIMSCSLCGGSMTLNGGKYACSHHRERGTCTNNKMIAAHRVEQRVLDGLKEKLLAPEAISAAIEHHRQASQVERRDLIGQRAPLEKALAGVMGKLKRAQEMCMAGVIEIEDLRTLTAECKAKQAELEAKLEKIETPSEVAIHPGAAAAYGALARRLQEVMQGSEGEEVRRALRELIEGVEFIPLQGMGRFDLKVRGKIAALLTMSETVNASTNKCEETLGAGTGFEPVTFRL